MTAESAPGPLVLLVEDDDETRTALRRDLLARAYRVDDVADGAGAIARWEARRPDVVLLDLGLPDMDGSQVIRRFRREATTPILVLSARDAEPTKVEALELGADDYVTKPFGLPELHARLRALLRRAAGPASDREGRLAMGPLSSSIRFVTRSRSVARSWTSRRESSRSSGSSCPTPGRLVTRGRVLRAVWGEAYRGEDHYVHVYVSQVRRKLAAADPDGSLRDLIVTEPGVGYRVREA